MVGAVGNDCIRLGQTLVQVTQPMKPSDKSSNPNRFNERSQRIVPGQAPGRKGDRDVEHHTSLFRILLLAPLLVLAPLTEVPDKEYWGLGTSSRWPP